MHSTRQQVNDKVWIILSLCVAVFFRILFIFSTPVPITMPDTYGYNSVGYRIQKGKLPVFNDERTPLYPVLFTLSMNIAGRTENRLDTPEFYRGAQLLSIVQSIVAVVAVYVLYKTLTLLRVPRALQITIPLLVGSDMMIFSYERFLLTESFAISWTIGFMYLSFLSLTSNRKSSYYILLTVYCLIGFLLRPIFVIFPFVLFFIHILTNKKAKTASLISLLVFSFVPIAYIASNTHNYRYTGINHITDVNVLGRIIKDGISIESAQHYTFYQTLKKYRQESTNNDPYAYLYFHDPTLLTRENNKKELNELKAFTTTILLRHPAAYIRGALKDIFPALREVPSQTRPTYTTQLRLLWNFLFFLSQILHTATILAIPLGIGAYSIGKKQNKQLLLLLGVTTTVLSAVVCVGYSDFGRLLIPIRVPLLLVFIISITTLIQKISRR